METLYDFMFLMREWLQAWHSKRFLVGRSLPFSVLGESLLLLGSTRNGVVRRNGVFVQQLFADFFLDDLDSSLTSVWGMLHSTNTAMYNASCVLPRLWSQRAKVRFKEIYIYTYIHIVVDVKAVSQKPSQMSVLLNGVFKLAKRVFCAE